MAPPAHVTDVSLRFKHGVETIFLFVDPLSPFSQISEQLLDVLRERYPDGLLISHEQPDRTPVPAKGDDYHVAYAALKNPKDPASGWKALGVRGTETPTSLKLKENTALAFRIETADLVDDTDSFVVQIPEPLDDEE